MILISIVVPGALADQGTPADPALEESLAEESLEEFEEPESTSEIQIDVEEPVESDLEATTQSGSNSAQVNSDVLDSAEIPTQIDMLPGQHQEFLFTYFVTTDRVATSMVVELWDGPELARGWSAELQVGDQKSEPGARTRFEDPWNTSEGAQIAFTLTIKAPAGLDIDHSVSLWIYSEVERLDGGTEEGIVAREPFAWITATPPPLIAPSISCDLPEVIEVTFGSTGDLRCDISVSDHRIAATVVVETSGGWTVETTESDHPPATTLSIGPLANSVKDSSARAVPLSLVLHPPVTFGPSGTLSIDLFTDPADTDPVSTTSVALQSTIPDDWQLTCAPTTDTVLAGASVTISCQVTEEAWNARGGQPEFSYEATSVSAGASGSTLVDSSFEFDLDLPCAASGDEVGVVTAHISDALTLETHFEILVEGAIISSPPTLSFSGGTLGTAEWIGDGYTTAESTVIVFIHDPADGCKPSPWILQATVSTFSNGNLDIEVPVVYAGAQSSIPNVDVGNPVVLSAGIPASVGSGMGGGQMTLSFESMLPATAPPGSYEGSLTFEVAVGP